MSVSGAGLTKSPDIAAEKSEIYDVTNFLRTCQAVCVKLCVSS